MFLKNMLWTLALNAIYQDVHIKVHLWIKRSYFMILHSYDLHNFLKRILQIVFCGPLLNFKELYICAKTNNYYVWKVQPSV